MTIQYCKPKLQFGSHDAVLLTKANNIKPHTQRLFRSMECYLDCMSNMESNMEARDVSGPPTKARTASPVGGPPPVN